LRITLKLFATLGPYLPQDRQGNLVELEVAEGTTPAALIDRFRVPEEMVHLVLLNGVYLEKDQRSSHALKSGDTVAIWPPVAGG